MTAATETKGVAMEEQTITVEDLNEIDVYCERATPAPWESDNARNNGHYGSGPDTHEGFQSYIALDAQSKVIFDTLNSDIATVMEEGDEDGHYAWDETGRLNIYFAIRARTDLPRVSQVLRKSMDRCAELEAALLQSNAELGQVKECQSCTRPAINHRCHAHTG